MAQISKYRLPEKTDNEIRSLFAEVLSMLSVKADIFAFLDDFLSPTERIVLSKRITIALLLKKGYSYEAIKAALNVSAPTVADVNQKLKFSGQGYHQVLDKILRYQKISNVFDKIETIILNQLSLGSGKGSGFWKELKYKKLKDQSSKII